MTSMKNFRAAAAVCLIMASNVLAAGPIENAGMQVVADAEGVQARGYRFENRCAKPTQWQAEWIWLAGEAPERGWFRKELTLDEAPQHVAAWMSADMKYRLWVNGQLVSRGPADIGRDYAGGLTHRWFYDYRDLTPFFHKGRNVIAAEVFRKGPGGVSRGKPGFLFEAQVDKFTLKTDATWRACPANGGLADWQAPEFDDAAWAAAQVVPNLWEPDIPSEIPPLMEARYPVLRVEGLPENKTFTKDGSFKVVFDRVLSGFPLVKVKGGKGARVTLKAHGSAAFVLGGGEETLEHPFMTEIAPAFTVEFKNVRAPVEVLDAGAVFTSQPVEYRGAFECSDTNLNRIWKVSRWAVQICLQTHYLDSPNHQEPISDPGDYLIEALVGHYAFAQPWLARQDVRKFAWLLKDEQYVNFHISYAIGWLQMLMDYYDYTGDQALVAEMAPYVHELLDTWASWRGKNGILSEAPDYMFMDWVNIGGFGCHHPPAVIGQGYLTAFYYHGMELASRVAALLGDGARVQAYAARRGEIAAAFNRELWVADKGLYRDGKPFQTHVKPGKWLPADKDIETFSPHVNLLAVLYDLAPQAQQQAIVEKVLSEEPLNTQPWFMHWVFQSIDHADLFDKYGTQQMRRWQIVPETQSFHEMWKGGDLSHGWCSTPLVQLSARVLGVTPTAPGFKTLAIRPTICDLAWAQGVVPTPQGDVVVSWKWANDTLQLDVTIPEGTEADVILPTKTEHVKAGRHSFEAPYKRVAQAVAVRPAAVQSAEADGKLDADVVKDDLLHSCLARVEDHCSHTGGGGSTAVLLNGTVRNGSGGTESADDGKTFRGYGNGDWLTFHLQQPCDLTEVRTFAGHSDARASQRYTVLVAYAADPGKFVQLASGAKPCDGGMSELRVPLKASGVIAVRLEFQSGPHGFNVYREINLLGQPTK
jgi:hypothetical protein